MLSRDGDGYGREEESGVGCRRWPWDQTTRSAAVGMSLRCLAVVSQQSNQRANTDYDRQEKGRQLTNELACSIEQQRGAIQCRPKKRSLYDSDRHALL